MTKSIKKLGLIFAYALICIALFFIFSVFKNNFYKFEIYGLEEIVEPITINLSFDKKIYNDNIEVWFNTNLEHFVPANYNNTYYTNFKKKLIVKNLRINLPSDIKTEEIESIYIYSGSRNYHYNKSDIKEFKKKYNSSTGYTTLKLPNINNYAGKFNHLCILFLSLFYNAQYFIFPYTLLLTAFLIIYFTTGINIKLNSKFIMPIIILAIILRINHLLYIPLWIDELYTKYTALANFKSTFFDPGNPPLFFALEFIFTKIFSNSDLSLRFLPMLFGVLTIPIIWLLFKKISINFALYSSFMAAINSIMIYRSQEARAYSLDIFLTIVSIYVLFKCLENPNIKNIILNAIMTALLANTNYYLLIIALGNILWGIIFLKKNKFRFYNINTIAMLSFLPYLISSIEKALDENFNSYIPKPSVNMIHDMVSYYFLNNTFAIIILIIVLVNFIICFIPKIKSKNKYYPYFFYIFNFTILCATLISIYIKPIMHTGNIPAIYGIFFLLVISAIYPIIDLKNKIIKAGIIIYTIFMSFLFTNITRPYNCRYIDNIKDYADLVTADAPKYHNNGYKIHAILPNIAPNLEEYPELEKLNYIKWHIITMGSDDIYIKQEDYLSDNSKSVLYIPLVNTEYFINETENIYNYYTNIISNVKLIH